MLASLRIETPQLCLSLVEPDDAEELIAFEQRNADHLRPWEPIRDPLVWFDPVKRRELLAQRRVEADADRLYSYVVRLRAGARAIIGTVTLSNVVRGAFQACHLGYAIDARHQGKGIAFEAVAAVVESAFTDLGLHRVMANYQPSNERSGKLLARLGFTIEGRALNYLLINGEWRDHILTARIAPDRSPDRD